MAAAGFARPEIVTVYGSKGAHAVFYRCDLAIFTPYPLPGRLAVALALPSTVRRPLQRPLNAAAPAMSCGALAPFRLGWRQHANQTLVRRKHVGDARGIIVVVFVTVSRVHRI